MKSLKISQKFVLLKRNLALTLSLIATLSCLNFLWIEQWKVIIPPPNLMYKIMPLMANQKGGKGYFHTFLFYLKLFAPYQINNFLSYWVGLPVPNPLISLIFIQFRASLIVVQLLYNKDMYINPTNAISRINLLKLKSYNIKK